MKWRVVIGKVKHLVKIKEIIDVCNYNSLTEYEVYTLISNSRTYIRNSEYDQKIPQSQTADKPVAS